MGKLAAEQPESRNRVELNNFFRVLGGPETVLELGVMALMYACFGTGIPYTSLTVRIHGMASS
jgi:hypothetical protein